MTKKHNGSQRVFGRRDRRDIPLENDAMFAEVMRRKDLCIGLLETIFEGRRIRDIVYEDGLSPEAQKYIAFNPGNKSIRLDVYFEDGDTVYDIEMQKVDTGNLPLRARMYSSMMDANMLDKGLEYERLKDSYVIFICMFDLFERGRTKYTFRSMCEEDGDLPLGDGRCIMFLNTKGSIGEPGADMDAFFEYLNGGVASIGTGKDSGSEFVEMVDNYVLDINGDEDWRQGYMKYELNLIEKYKEGMASGEARGEARGISIGEARGVSNERNRMVKEMNANGIPVSVIAKCASLDIKEVQRVINSK